MLFVGLTSVIAKFKMKDLSRDIAMEMNCKLIIPIIVKEAE
jgi:hypothetical protein